MKRHQHMKQGTKGNKNFKSTPAVVNKRIHDAPRAPLIPRVKNVRYILSTKNYFYIHGLKEGSLEWEQINERVNCIEFTGVQRRRKEGTRKNCVKKPFFRIKSTLPAPRLKKKSSAPLVKKQKPSTLSLKKKKPSRKLINFP